MAVADALTLVYAVTLCYKYNLIGVSVRSNVGTLLDMPRSRCVEECGGCSARHDCTIRRKHIALFLRALFEKHDDNLVAF